MLSLYDAIKAWEITSTVGFFTYWLPLALCALGYSVKTWKQIQLLNKYRQEKYNTPWVEDLTVGTLLWRMFLTVTPIVNVIALVFGLLSDMLKTVFNWIDWVLSYRVVKK